MVPVRPQSTHSLPPSGIPMTHDLMVCCSLPQKHLFQSSRLGMQNVRLSEVQFLIFDTPDNKCKLLEQEKAVPFVKLSAYTIIGTT
jgi:hypothetical protein